MASASRWALLAVLGVALAACGGDEDDQATGQAEQAPAAVEEVVADDTGLAVIWSDEFVREFNDIAVVLPPNRAYNLTATGFCPSLDGQVETLEDYDAQCGAIVADSIQYVIDRYACLGQGDTFYAAVSVNTAEAAEPFITTPLSEYSLNRLFTIEGMKRQSEKFGNDAYTVSVAEPAGSADGTHVHGDADEQCPASFQYYREDGALKPF